MEIAELTYDVVARRRASLQESSRTSGTRHIERRRTATGLSQSFITTTRTIIISTLSLCLKNVLPCCDDDFVKSQPIIKTLLLLESPLNSQQNTCITLLTTQLRRFVAFHVSTTTLGQFQSGLKTTFRLAYGT